MMPGASAACMLWHGTLHTSAADTRVEEKCEYCQQQGCGCVGGCGWGARYITICFMLA